MSAPSQPRDLPQVLLTVEELAVLMRCGKTRANELIRDEVVPSILVGGTMRRVRLDDALEYLKSLKPSPVVGDRP